jgi:hypothetical protein
MVKSPLELSTNYKNKPVDAKWKTLPDVGFRTQVFEADSDWLRNVTFKILSSTKSRSRSLCLHYEFLWCRHV